MNRWVIQFLLHFITLSPKQSRYQSNACKVSFEIWIAVFTDHLLQHRWKNIKVRHSLKHRFFLLFLCTVAIFIFSSRAPNPYLFVLRIFTFKTLVLRILTGFWIYKLIFMDLDLDVRPRTYTSVSDPDSQNQDPNPGFLWIRIQLDPDLGFGGLK